MLSPKIRVQSHCNDVYSTMLLVAHLRGVVSQLTERHLPLIHSFVLTVETGQAISQISPHPLAPRRLYRRSVLVCVRARPRTAQGASSISPWIQVFVG